MGARFGLVLSAACVLLSLLTGCGGVSQSYAVYPHYVGSAATYAAADRDLKLVVIGNPTALPRERFEAAVAAAMQGQNGQRGTRFTTSPGESWRKDYRVVVAFGAPVAATGPTYCRYAPPPEPVMAGPPIRIVFAFCDGERLMSEVLAFVPSLDRPGDLERLMAQTVYALMPPLSPDERQGPGDMDVKVKRPGGVRRG
jgi:hypothetical protein